MTKRLRGWQLEQAMRESSEQASSSKGPWKKGESVLASKLLSLWTHGLLSATQIQEIAHLAVLDGAHHEELVAMAKAGSYGQKGGNVHRDMMGAFCKEVAICEPHHVAVPCIDPKTNKPAEEQAAIFLPHMMFLDWFGPDYFRSSNRLDAELCFLFGTTFFVLIFNGKLKQQNMQGSLLWPPNMPINLLLCSVAKAWRHFGRVLLRKRMTGCMATP
jgi:hypothetical protein